MVVSVFPVIIRDSPFAAPDVMRTIFPVWAFAVRPVVTTVLEVEVPEAVQVTSAVAARPKNDLNRQFKSLLSTVFLLFQFVQSYDWIWSPFTRQNVPSTEPMARTWDESNVDSDAENTANL